MKRHIVIAVVTALSMAVILVPAGANHADPLVALYHLDEKSGTTVTDSAHGVTGTATDANTGNTDGNTPPAIVGGTSAMFGRARTFDGVDDYVRGVTNTALSELTGPFSVEAWINSAGDNTATNSQSIVGKWNEAPGTRSFELLLNRADSTTLRPRFRIRTAAGPVLAVEASASNVAGGGWYHIVGTFQPGDGISDGELRIYVNGADAGTTTAGPSDTAATSDAPFRIGARGTSAGAPMNFFKGAIDEVRVWADALDAIEIAESYALGEAANNGDTDTVLKHVSGSTIIFSSAYHSVEDGDTVEFRMMRVDTTAGLDETEGDDCFVERPPSNPTPKKSKTPPPVWGIAGQTCDPPTEGSITAGTASGGAKTMHVDALLVDDDDNASKLGVQLHMMEF